MLFGLQLIVLLGFVCAIIRFRLYKHNTCDRVGVCLSTAAWLDTLDGGNWRVAHARADPFELKLCTTGPPEQPRSDSNSVTSMCVCVATRSFSMASGSRDGWRPRSNFVWLQA